MNTCLSCNRSEQEVTLLVLQYQGKAAYICPQCLPVLIHKPEKMADKLPGAEKFGPPAEHHH